MASSNFHFSILLFLLGIVLIVLALTGHSKALFTVMSPSFSVAVAGLLPDILIPPGDPVKEDQ